MHPNRQDPVDLLSGGALSRDTATIVLQQRPKEMPLLAYLVKLSEELWDAACELSPANTMHPEEFEVARDREFPALRGYRASVAAGSQLRLVG